MRTLAGSKGPAAPLCIVKKWVLEICVCVSLSTNIYIDMYIHMYAHMCVCVMCVCVCMCLQVHISYLCIYSVCMCTYIYMYIYIYTALYYIYIACTYCVYVCITVYIYILIDTRLVESLLLAKNSARHGSHLWKAGSQQNWWWIQQESLGGFRFSVLSWGYPQLSSILIGCSLKISIHYKPSRYWGSPIYGNPIPQPLRNH